MLIEKETLLKQMEGYCSANCGHEHGEDPLCPSCFMNDAIILVEDQPAADVRPVVRGEWKEWWPGDCALIMTGEEMLWACSECGSKYSEKQNYCPNCGADMRAETC